MPLGFLLSDPHHAGQPRMTVVKWAEFYVMLEDVKHHFNDARKQQPKALNTSDLNQ